MGLLVVLLGAIAGAIYALVRFMSAANEGREAISDIKGAVRRGKWSKQIDSRLVENLDDPRDAAAVLMVQIAAYDGEITTRQKDAITGLMMQHFHASREEAEGLYSFGRMAIGQINDAANALGKMIRPVKEALTLDEMKELAVMLEEVSEVEGPPTERQRDLIVQVRRALSLDNVH